jgi:GT2 family glycosyltransferase
MLTHVLTVVIPFHRNLAQLERCLDAVRASAAGVTEPVEVVVVADGAMDDCTDLVHRHDARMLSRPRPGGPGVARNHGARSARGEIVVFVDSDVVLHVDALPRLRAGFEAMPDVAAIFGAYDEQPADAGFVSQAKNLTHAFVHQTSGRDATTFWGGLGAVRMQAWRAVGGFSEAFPRPSVEDIEFGYRLSARGFRIRLDPGIRGTHLKRWSAGSALLSDLRDRGIPWTRLLYRYRALRSDLNLTWTGRACTLLAWLAILGLAFSWWFPILLLAAASAIGLLGWVERSHYRWLADRRGANFAARWFPLRAVHHAMNGVSLVIGTVLYLIDPGFPAAPPPSAAGERAPDVTVAAASIGGNPACHP